MLEDVVRYWKLMDTHIQNILREARLGHDRVLVNPGVGILGLVVHALLCLVHLDQVRNVVLLESGEPLTLHDGGNDASEKLVVEVDGVIVAGHGAGKQTDQLEAGLVHGTTLRDGDEVSGEPGELAESADEALVRTLGALLGEGGLVC